MIEIKNINKFQVQVLVRSRKSPRSFTTLNIPGVGKGKNIYLLEDERITDDIERKKDKGLISIRHIPNKLQKGE